jgi:hypothetical protein
MLKDCIVENICSNICINNPIYIYQIDFDNGPYIISKPGIYILMENIKTQFFKTKELALNISPYDKLGHSAALKIECENVILDLNGYHISQSPQDYCVQRFFALIQLNDMPFNPQTGPITTELRTKIKTAHNCIIKNGELRLSSHQSILGNNNENIIIENLKCENFEVTGININNGLNIYIENCIFGNSLGSPYSNGIKSIVPLTPIFAGLTFIHKLLNSILDNDTLIKSTSDIETLNETIEEINNLLNPILCIIYQYTTLSEIFNNLVQLCNSCTNKDLCLFVNMTGLSPCNVQGIKFTGKNPSIGPFHTSVELENNMLDVSNINIKNVMIRNLVAEINERVLLTENSQIIHIGAGLKITTEIIDTSIGQYLINSIYNLITSNLSIKEIIKSNISYDVVNFVNNNINNGNIGFKRSMDIMGHVNKGVIGMRIGSIQKACIDNIKIYNIKNNGKELSDIQIENIINSYDGISDIEMVDTTLISPLIYSGSYSIGYIISGSSCIDNNLIKIYNIKSPYGCSIGFAVNNLCNNILLEKCDIYDLLSSEKSSDSNTLLIDYKSKCIRLNNINIY